jgi:polysaccharide biosynthesis/export protein
MFFFLLKMERIIIFLCFLSFFSSCIPNKSFIYFPDPKFNTKVPVGIVNKPHVYKLQPRDVISIKVKTLDLESSSYFNIQPENTMFNFNQGIAYLNGYSLDENGFVKLPEVGLIKVGGLTTAEAQDMIQNSLSVYLSKSTILVKLISFKVTILGEVHRPGHYYIYNDQATILECLGMAGDLNDFGNRENITLIRQGEPGVNAILINLKDPALLSSEFYYLQPNDVLYVQPVRAKVTRTNLGAFNVLSLAFGLVSSSILILNFLSK